MECTLHCDDAFRAIVRGCTVWRRYSDGKMTARVSRGDGGFRSRGRRTDEETKRKGGRGEYYRQRKGERMRRFGITGGVPNVKRDTVIFTVGIFTLAAVSVWVHKVGMYFGDRSAANLQEDAVSSSDGQDAFSSASRAMGLDSLSKELFGNPPGRRARFAIISAHNGKVYDVMANLASETKAQYARLYGYSYFSDSDLLSDKMSFTQKSGSRIAAFRRHLDDYDWLLWLDTDVLITNASMSLESLVDLYAPPGSGHFVVLSRDWGGRQVNPGVTLLSTGREGRAFLDRWAVEIGLVDRNDDLMAIREGMEKKHAPELEYVSWVPQQVLNSYAHLELEHQPFDRNTVEHHKSHHLWTQGDQFVHVVNCLRQSHKLDHACCNGIAAFYYVEFMKSLREVQLRDSGAPSLAQSFEQVTWKDWTRPFFRELCVPVH
ncbi:hypothetical protein FVE85_2935 [Porphyridium purpureum]|uniref:Glycosyltransferase family 34 protein n=1 Tax=Porphyridium purpureum TaxID=35688 RepID=A0A5J4YVG2_PORPP|nr:hypothetical protein FVE85_2935 [Porphyridium purpureum]|eukprot:POR7704..scf227_4